MKNRKIASAHVAQVIIKECREKSLEQLGNTLIPKEELTYGVQLNKMGRNASFEEYFNGVKLENQIFPKVGPFEDPTKTISFSEGYKRGIFLIEKGIITEEKFKNEKETKKHM